jgi:hypothetical protein
MTDSVVEATESAPVLAYVATRTTASLMELMESGTDLAYVTTRDTLFVNDEIVSETVLGIVSTREMDSVIADRLSADALDIVSDRPTVAAMDAMDSASVRLYVKARAIDSEIEPELPSAMKTWEPTLSLAADHVAESAPTVVTPDKDSSFACDLPHVLLLGVGPTV